MSLGDLAMRLKASPPAVGYSIERGENIARENVYRLIEYFFTFLPAPRFPGVSGSTERLMEKDKKSIRVVRGKKISAAFYETICIYPEQKDLLLYLRRFCSERFFKVVVAEILTDLLAIPHFVAIIKPSVLGKKDWSSLYDYLNEVPYTWNRFVLSSKTQQPRIPKSNGVKSPISS